MVLIIFPVNQCYGSVNKNKIITEVPIYGKNRTNSNKYFKSHFRLQ